MDLTFLSSVSLILISKLVVCGQGSGNNRTRNSGSGPSHLSRLNSNNYNNSSVGVGGKPGYLNPRYLIANQGKLPPEYGGVGSPESDVGSVDSDTGDFVYGYNSGFNHPGCNGSAYPDPVQMAQPQGYSAHPAPAFNGYPNDFNQVYPANAVPGYPEAYGHFAGPSAPAYPTTPVQGYPFERSIHGGQPEPQTLHKDHYYYIRSRPRFIHPRLRPRRQRQFEPPGPFPHGPLPRRTGRRPVSSDDDGFIPIPNRSAHPPGHLAGYGHPGFVPPPGPLGAPYGYHPGYSGPPGDFYGFPGHPMHPGFPGIPHPIPPIHPHTKPQENLLILDIAYIGPTNGYSMTIDGSKKIFRANPPYLFGKVIFGTETLWSYNNNGYPNKVVYKIVNGEYQLKVYFPPEKPKEPALETAPEAAAVPAVTKAAAHIPAQTAAPTGGIQIPTNILNLQIPRVAPRLPSVVAPDAAAKVEQPHVSVSVPTVPAAVPGVAVDQAPGIPTPIQVPPPVVPQPTVPQPTLKPQVPAQPMPSVVPQPIPSVPQQPVTPEPGISFQPTAPGVAMPQQPVVPGPAAPQQPVAPETVVHPTLTPHVPIPSPQPAHVPIPPAGTAGIAPEHLITIDLNNIGSTDKVEHSFDAPKKAHILKTKPPYLIEKVTRGGKLRWEAKNGRYGNKLVVTVDSQGVLHPKMFYPADPSVSPAGTQAGAAQAAKPMHVVEAYSDFSDSDQEDDGSKVKVESFQVPRARTYKQVEDAGIAISPAQVFGIPPATPFATAQTPSTVPAPQMGGLQPPSAAPFGQPQFQVPPAPQQFVPQVPSVDPSQQTGFQSVQIPVPYSPTAQPDQSQTPQVAATPQAFIPSAPQTRAQPTRSDLWSDIELDSEDEIPTPAQQTSTPSTVPLSPTHAAQSVDLAQDSSSKADEDDGTDLVIIGPPVSSSLSSTKDPNENYVIPDSDNEDSTPSDPSSSSPSVAPKPNIAPDTASPESEPSTPSTDSPLSESAVSAIPSNDLTSTTPSNDFSTGISSTDTSPSSGSSQPSENPTPAESPLPNSSQSSEASTPPHSSQLSESSPTADNVVAAQPQTFDISDSESESDDKKTGEQSTARVKLPAPDSKQSDPSQTVAMAESESDYESDVEGPKPKIRLRDGKPQDSSSHSLIISESECETVESRVTPKPNLSPEQASFDTNFSLDLSLTSQDETKCEVKDESGVKTYTFKSGVKCARVILDSKPVWLDGDVQLTNPESVSFNEQENTITVSCSSGQAIYTKESDGNWKLPPTTPPNSENNQQSDPANPDGSTDASNQPSSDGSSTPPDKPSEPEKPKELKPVELNIKTKEITAEFDYIKEGKVGMYTPNSGYGFSTVKTKTGGCRGSSCNSSDVTIWETKDKKNLSKKVVVKGLGKKDKTVSINFDDCIKVYKKNSENKWVLLNTINNENVSSGGSASSTSTPASGTSGDNASSTPPSSPGTDSGNAGDASPAQGSTAQGSPAEGSSSEGTSASKTAFELNIDVAAGTDEFDRSEDSGKNTVTFTSKNNNAFSKVKTSISDDKSEVTVWETANTSEYSEKVELIKYPSLQEYELIITLGDGTTKKFIFSKIFKWAFIDPNNPKIITVNILTESETYKYNFETQGNSQTFSAKKGFKFNRALEFPETTKKKTDIWNTDNVNEHSTKLVKEGTNKLTIYIGEDGRTKKVFNKGSDGKWTEDPTASGTDSNSTNPGSSTPGEDSKATFDPSNNPLC